MSDLLEAYRQVKELAKNVGSEAEAREVSSRIAQLTRRIRIGKGDGMAENPLEQAVELDSTYAPRPHLHYLSDRIAQAVRDVEQGKNRRLAVSMPPRTGKSTLTSNFAPLWMLRRNPNWKIVMTAHDSTL